VKKSTALLVVGFPNVSTRSSSDVIRVDVMAGPQRKRPANAPTLVDTAGITVVKSISDTLTPGET
jgi:hypothetical protein